MWGRLWGGELGEEAVAGAIDLSASSRVVDMYESTYFERRIRINDHLLLPTLRAPLRLRRHQLI